MDEIFPNENYNIFHLDADSVYSSLVNTADSNVILINFNNEVTYSLILNNYSVYTGTAQDSASFSKTGFVDSHPNSSVIGHFSQEYFSLRIEVDSLEIVIDALNIINEQFASLENVYVVHVYRGASAPDDFEEGACEEYKIELGIMIDHIALAQYNNNTELLRTHLEAQILRIEKSFNNDISEFGLDMKILRLVFLPASSTQHWNYINKSLLHDQYHSSWNARFCEKPDVYILITGHSLGGAHALPGICHTNQVGYPGLAIVSTHQNLFPQVPGDIAGITVDLAHEIMHVLGAGEGEANSNCDCVGKPNCTPSYLMCQHMCWASHAVKMKLAQCSINEIKDNLAADCASCLSAFSSAPCPHCEFTGDIRADEIYPFIAGCDSRNEFNVTFSFVNDCDARTVFMRATYNNVQLERISGLNGFNPEVIVDDQMILDGSLVALGPEQKQEYTVRFRLKDGAFNNHNVNNLILGFQMYNTGGAVSPPFDLDPNFITYVVPAELNGNVYLSDVLEPENGFVFEDDNVTGCNVSNKPVRINGSLFIDTDYCLNNTRVIMGPGAKIVVQNGKALTINKDNILGCEEMWDAIIVEDGGVLVVNESNIEDAITAIRLEENSVFSTSATRYHNNDIAIKAELSQAGDVDFQVLAGNTISADDVLSKAPRAELRAKAGIWLVNVDQAFIEGEPPHISPGLNRIGNLSNGIVLFNTDASIHNFHLYDIRSPNPKTFVPDEQPDGHAIYINGSSGMFTTAIGSADTRDNYINGSHTGIFVKGTDVDIRYCNVYKALSAIILGYHPNGQSVIANSLINASYRGIQLRLPTSLEVDILDNRITMTAESGVGIETLSSWGEVNIEDNLLLLNKSGEGISLTDARNVIISDNRLIFEDIGVVPMRGISLEASTGCLIQDNMVIGKNIDQQTTGIYLQDSPLNRVLCNNVRMANMAYQFSGINSMTNYHANLHHASDYGLLLGTEASGSDATMGAQFHKQNTWPASSYGTDGAWILSADPLIIVRSIFTVDDSKPTYYPPNLTELIGLGWFEDLPVEEYSFDCHDRPVDADICCEFSVPEDTIIAFETYPEVKNHHLRSHLYSALRDGMIDTLETSALYQFYQRSDTTQYGRLVRARQSFYSAMEGDINQRSTDITSALSFTSAVPDHLDHLRYEVDANVLLADYLAGGDLEVLIEEEQNIRNVAALCPYAYGTGVYMNRAWLRAIDLEAKFDELDACGVIEPRSDESFGSGERTETRYVIFPNPAGLGREITLHSSQPIAGFEIANLWGGMEMRQDLSAQRISETRIQLPHYGLYFLKVWDHDHSSQVLKIFVVE